MSRGSEGIGTKLVPKSERTLIKGVIVFSAIGMIQWELAKQRTPRGAGLQPEPGAVSGATLPQSVAISLAGERGLVGAFFLFLLTGAKDVTAG